MKYDTYVGPFPCGVTSANTNRRGRSASSNTILSSFGHQFCLLQSIAVFAFLRHLSGGDLSGAAGWLYLWLSGAKTTQYLVYLASSGG